MTSPEADDEDELLGTLEAIMLEQTQAPWQSRTARWTYRTEHLQELLPEPEPEPEPEQQEEEDAEDEEGTDEEQQPIATLGEAQAAATRSAEVTHRIQTAHTGRYANWRDPRVYTVPGHEAASLLRREVPLPSFSMWRAEEIESLVNDVLAGKIGPSPRRMRQQEELLLSRLKALEGAVELGRWRGEDLQEHATRIELLRRALQKVQTQIEPHIRELAEDPARRASPEPRPPTPEQRPSSDRLPASRDMAPAWTEAETALARAAQQLEASRAAVLTQASVPPLAADATEESLADELRRLKTIAARTKAKQQSEQLQLRAQQLQYHHAGWRQQGSYLPADELIL